MNKRRLVAGLLICSLAVALLGGCDSAEDKPGPSRAKPTARASAQGADARDKPFVASVWRDPFHRGSCRWAGKIATKNLIGYDSREDAIADGHRPCKVCRP